ncbi:hypothetical protein KIH79_11615 [Bifidobacterium sp. 82T10]|uniref:Uncharacterized protein n=1 Tax=Bifidobacterium miconis TaxID=2834435 RepID=A0ABS6WHM2_9BIFI|nr:hypothetical protein [Bifidobacterium miconis]MBW3093555.1 hypothetical protein [Bifidobacterium miconis]
MSSASVDINDQVDDLSADEVINDKPLKRAVGIGFVLLAISMFMPGKGAPGVVREIVMTAGAWTVIVPLLFVAWHQHKTKRHFGFFFHMLFPIIGSLMVAARIVLVPMGMSTIFLNLWSIGGTFLIFPLVQQLIELISGSVDMETGGRQVRFDQDI